MILETKVYRIVEARVTSSVAMLTVADDDGDVTTLEAVTRFWPLPGSGEGHPMRNAYPMAALIGACGGDPATITPREIAPLLRGKTARLRVIGDVLVAAQPI